MYKADLIPVKFIPRFIEGNVSDNRTFPRR